MSKKLSELMREGAEGRDPIQNRFVENIYRRQEEHPDVVEIMITGCCAVGAIATAHADADQSLIRQLIQDPAEYLNIFFPELNTVVPREQVPFDYSGDSPPYSLREVIIYLNDVYTWSIGEIADFLEKRGQ